MVAACPRMSTHSDVGGAGKKPGPRGVEASEDVPGAGVTAGGGAGTAGADDLAWKVRFIHVANSCSPRASS
eukprot:4144863-Pyramimonas_sp.AAC.1